MRRALFLLATLALVACGGAPPAPTGPDLKPTWTASVRGTPVTWEIVQPGSLGRLDGDPNGPVVGARAHMGASPCRIEIDTAATRADMALYAAHEVGHCLQAFYKLPGIPRPDLGPYFAGGTEGFAETYALAYKAACGDSLEPLGWKDARVATCPLAPDPPGLP